jgi:nicotinamidase-related amidase
MSNLPKSVCRAALAAAIVMLTFATWAAAADILDDWAKVEPPPAPEPKAVTLDGATTAVIIGDMNQVDACSKNPRCAATVDPIKRLTAAGRAAGAMFWFSLPGKDSKPSDMIDPALIPRDGEWERINGPDKFRDSHLEEKLKERHIETAIVCGHSFQGVGIGTATGLALRGFKVIIPVDCLASNNPYATYLEQYSVWHLYKSGNGVAPHVTITRSSMVTFK